MIQLHTARYYKLRLTKVKRFLKIVQDLLTRRRFEVR